METDRTVPLHVEQRACAPNGGSDPVGGRPARSVRRDMENGMSGKRMVSIGAAVVVVTLGGLATPVLARGRHHHRNKGPEWSSTVGGSYTGTNAPGTAQNGATGSNWSPREEGRGDRAGTPARSGFRSCPISPASSGPTLSAAEGVAGSAPPAERPARAWRSRRLGDGGRRRGRHRRRLPDQRRRRRRGQRRQRRELRSSIGVGADRRGPLPRRGGRCGARRPSDQPDPAATSPAGRGAPTSRTQHMPGRGSSRAVRSGRSRPASQPAMKLRLRPQTSSV